ncbi:MAG: tetratricopeptide repeat protein, partial [Halobacteriovoraceae bacterium]|nr:tetratricopeptide repeat protein [Halobacteriovoraceae bacterium]
MRLGIILLFLSSFICFLQAQEIVRESVNQIASSSTMKELALFYKFYRTGKYSQALKELKKLEGRPRIRGNLPYFRGMCYKKLQQYDEAIEEFKKAIQNGDRTKGIFYEYGQALYANNELERARKAFDLSFKRNYKAPFSLYYMAQIASIIEDASATKTNFVKIIENKRAEKNILQVAYFQLAELIYNLIKKKFDPHKYVQKYVIPLLDKAYEVDQDSAAAVDIFKRKDEILIAHKIHPYVMVNGRKVSRKDIVLNFQGTYSQDDN